MRWHGTLAVAAAVLTCAVCARAEHEAARRLAKRIDVSFIETPLERAVQEVGRLANVAVVVDKKGLDASDRRFPVSLQLDGTPARAVLDLIAKDAGIGYRLEGLVAFISSRARSRRAETTLRTFDVRDITGSVTDFPGPDYSMVESFATGNYGAMAARGGPMTLEETPPEVMCEAGSLAELIMSRIHPTEWDAALGTSIEERGGRLFVMQTKEVHDAIAGLLAEVRASEGVFIRVEATAHLASSAAVTEALEGTALPGFLTPDERARVFARLAEAGARRLGSARTVCLNNQRTHVVSGAISNFVSDVDISGAVYDPVVSQTFEGFILDVRPVASHDRKFVTLWGRAEAPTPARPPESRTVVTGESGVVMSTDGGGWSLEKKGDNIEARGGGANGLAATQLAPVRIQTLDVASRHIVTNVQVPNRHTAYFLVPAGRRPGGETSVLFTIRPGLIVAGKEVR
ncbi:MAG: hypothetical protein ACYTKD_03265 [Planctomycetota bacterium]|jgi:hypothetical protein